MAMKRPHSDVHPSRREQVPTEPKAKRQKPDHIKGKSFKKAYTVHEIKLQIRSLRRLLEHNDSLPANVRVDKERALQSAQHELLETERAKKRSEMIGKWHKVRFFERQKASKRLKRARKELEELEMEGEGAGEREEVEKRVMEAEVDVNYAIYFALEKEYVPLFPKRRKQDSEDDADDESPEPSEMEREGDPEMWQRVKRCMADGTLDALRNGKFTEGKDAGGDDQPPPVPAAPPKKKRQKVEAPPVHGNRRERRKAAAAAKAESEEDSEGGFFE